MNPSPTIVHLLLVLHAEGPLTTHRLADETDRHQQSVKTAIEKSRQRYGSAVFRVAAWDQHFGTPGPPAPCYAPGPGRDVPKPKADARAAERRYDQRNRVKRALYRRIKRATHRAQPFDGLLNRVSQKSFS